MNIERVEGMTQHEIFYYWVRVLDCIINQEDTPPGLLEALTRDDPERAGRFAQFMIDSGCATVTAVQSEPQH